jgi:methyl-accepting chemotaxis protein
MAEYFFQHYTELFIIFLLIILIHIFLNRRSYHEDLKEDYIVTRNKINNSTTEKMQKIEEENLEKFNDFLESRHVEFTNNFMQLKKYSDDVNEQNSNLLDQIEKQNKQIEQLSDKLKKQNSIIERKSKQIKRLKNGV